MNTHHVKVGYNNLVHPRQYNEGDLVLLYDQYGKPLRERKFNHMWHGPYIVRCFLKKGYHELEDYEGNVLKETRNGL